MAVDLRRDPAPMPDCVVVRLHVPVDLPLTIPGSPGSASVAATGSAYVDPD